MAEQVEDGAALVVRAEGQVGATGRRAQHRQAPSNHAVVDRQANSPDAWSRAPASALRRTSSARPARHARAVNSAMQWRRDFGDPLVVDEAVAQRAHLARETKAVGRTAARDEARTLAVFPATDRPSGAAAASLAPVPPPRRACAGSSRRATQAAFERAHAPPRAGRDAILLPLGIVSVRVGELSTVRTSSQARWRGPGAHALAWHQTSKGGHRHAASCRETRRRLRTRIPLSMSHIGLYVHDLPRMEDFYTRVLGFTVTDRGKVRGADIVFTSWDPKDHHQVALGERTAEGPRLQSHQPDFVSCRRGRGSAGGLAARQGRAGRQRSAPDGPRQCLVALFPRSGGQSARSVLRHAVVHRAAVPRRPRPVAAGRPDPRQIRRILPQRARLQADRANIRRRSPPRWA